MKYRLHSQLPEVTIPGMCGTDDVSSVQGKALIDSGDNVGFTLYETRPAVGKELSLKSPEDVREGEPGTNHFYYCLHGQAEVRVLESGERYTMETNSILGLPPAAEATLKISAENTRFCIIHSSGNSSDVCRPRPTFKKLSEILGTERDVDWSRGRSRRFFVKDDGFNISIHNTVCDPGHSSPLWYRQNYEGCYCIRGDLKYEWDDGKFESSFNQTDVSEGDGWLILMDKNDPHVLHTLSQECEGLCLFYPPLKGTEVHDFSTDGFSVY